MATARAATRSSVVPLLFLLAGKRAKAVAYPAGQNKNIARLCNRHFTREG